MNNESENSVSAKEVLPKREHKYTLIFLHGLGDSGDGWSEIANFTRIKNPALFDHVKFIFPNAEMRPITINGGMVMPGWADVVSFDASNEDTKGFMESSSKIQKLIENEIKSGISSNNILLGGFSQGGAVAYLTLLRSGFTFAGCVCLSTWVPTVLNSSETIKLSNPEAIKTPIFHGHGTDDALVLLKYGKDSVGFMRTFGFQVEMKEYPNMGHESSALELDDVATFMTKALSQAPGATANN